MSDLSLRLATVDDLGAINSIYNFYVMNSVTTYQEAPETMDQRSTWFARHGGPYPVTVASIGAQVVGWASLSPFHVRSAYRWTVENSVYVDHAHHRRGIGRALLGDSIERARAAGHHTIIAGIDSEQAASIKLHEKMGFIEVARLREVGHKCGRWLDVIYMQKMLGA